ncbi:MAG: 4Fe-4S dicluster domain-containing protein [Pseudomonadales bacterium]|jgi:DMSO reductase family type II enzyme iron-sulfur subunit|nr:4Fe-4S dicluster domain-containing protein [Pseudomonadales bacterium]
MKYAIPKSERQVAMVLDLNKCLGCHTCSVACKKMWNTDEGTDYAYWNNVETMPGKGYPARVHDPDTAGRNLAGETKRGQLPGLDTGYGRAWKFNHKDVLASTGRETKEWLRPTEEVKWGPNFDEDQGEGVYPADNHYFYLPRLCNHCTHPACLDACPRSAIHKRQEDGIVLVDQDRCHGYRFCVEACPYKKIYYDHVRQVSSKCIFCLPRVEEGVAPACARQCPGRLRFVGYRDDQEGPIWKLVEKWQVAIPLHPEYGLGPNVFYVPPMSPPKLDEQGRETTEPRIPLAYLESLFGPAVQPALDVLLAERAKTKRGETSELMDLLIAYNWHDNFKLAPGLREVLA